MLKFIWQLDCINNYARMSIKVENRSKLKAIAYCGAACMSIALLVQIFWINAFNAAETHEERLSTFNSFFPEFLHGSYTLTFTSIGFCVVAIVLSNITLKLAGVWKTLSLTTLTISVLLLLLNLYQLM